MSHLDRYILKQMAMPFLFFLVVATSLIWLGQSLRSVEIIVNSGRSGLIFLDLMVLLLPRVMIIVLPLAALAATLYIFNRLKMETEIAAMLAAGVSELSLLRPVVMGATALAAAVASLSVWVAPGSQVVLQDRLAHVRSDLAAALVREGTFITKIPGMTAYVTELGRPGELIGVFLHDERNPRQVTTYTAERALLIDGDEGLRLVLVDGIAQIASVSDHAEVARPLSILRFRHMAFDLSNASEDPNQRHRKVSELTADRLVTMTAEEIGEWTLGEVRAEGHEALSSPLYVLAFPMLAVAILMRAGHSRQGLSPVIAATGAAILLRLIGLAIKALVTTQAAMWPFLYVPPLLGIVLSVWLLRGAPFRQSYRRRQSEFAVLR